MTPDIVNFSNLKTAIEERLINWPERFQRLGNNSLYMYISATALMPLVGAMATQQPSVISGELWALLGGLGANLLAGVLQKFRDAEDEAVMLAMLEEALAEEPEWSEQLDAVLQKLDVMLLAESALKEADKTWFVQTLHEELSQIEFPTTYQGEILAVGEGATAMGERAMQVGGDTQGIANTGTITTQGDVVGRDKNQTINNIFNQFTTSPENRDQLADQLIAYLQWVREWSGTIELRGIKREGESVIQLPLETVYVPLQASASRQREIQLDEVLPLGDRLVITGGPGSGKTTVLLHMAWALAETILTDRPTLAEEKLGLKPQPKPDNQRRGEQPTKADIPIPIFVSISQYAYYLRHETSSDPHKKTLAYFLTHYLIQQQAHLKGGTDFLTALLEEGHTVLLLLDGLDEVPDEADRAFVTEAIEHLVMARKQIRVVVTCRTAAYGGRTALGRGFQTVQVRALSQDHIQRLIQQAYACIYPKNVGEQQLKSQDLIDGIATLEARRRARLGKDTEPLVDSPLLVRMLLIVHFSDRRLPDHRAELYMRATDVMLLPDYGQDNEVADRLGASVGGSREVHREMVQHLAFHMHQRGEEQGREIDEDGVRAVLQQEANYATAIDPFIHLTRLRGTLLEERLGLYRFIHLSFQEYLVARYLADIVRGVQAIVSFLAEGPILQSWWREVVLLTVGYLSVTTPHIARQLLEQMVKPEQVNSYPPAVQLALAELAFKAVHEWQERHPHQLTLVEQQLLTIFADRERMAQIPAQQRVAVGVTLGEVGDPRPEVMTIEGMPFCYVPAGAFWMGEGEASHQVNISYAYWLGQFPVTQAQFNLFVEAGGYEQEAYWAEAKELRYWAQGRGFKGRFDDEWRKRPLSLRHPFMLPNHPAVGISWYESLAFCRWLTEQLPKGWQARLPSEAEWEKGARGGLQVPTQPIIQPLAWLQEQESPLQENPSPKRTYVWGDTPPQAGQINFKETGVGSTTALGCFIHSPSVYGCQEMSGNVWEWTRTNWGHSYPYERNDGREDMLANSSTSRIIRGGAYLSSSTNVRCSARRGDYPVIRLSSLGFRVIVVASPFPVSGA